MYLHRNRKKYQIYIPQNSQNTCVTFIISFVHVSCKNCNAIQSLNNLNNFSFLPAEDQLGSITNSCHCNETLNFNIQKT